MAFTKATLKAALGSYLQAAGETGFDTYLDTFITQAEDRINRGVTLPVNRKSGVIVLTNGQVLATLPDDFLAPFELRISDSGIFTAVEYVDVSLIREAYPNPLMVGVPRWYSLFDNDQIILGPTPRSGLTGWMNYFYDPPSITAGGDSNTSWLGTNAENCLLYACLAEGYTYLKGDPDLMKLYEDRYQLALTDLRKLGEGYDMGDAFRMGEVRSARR